MAEMLRTNQMQIEMLAKLAEVLGKVTDLLIPSGPPEASTGRFSEEWLVQKEAEDR